MIVRIIPLCVNIICYCAGSAIPPDNDCLCDPEVVAVDLSDQDILFTLVTKEKTENCPIHFTVKDTCFPNTCSFSDKPCDFNKAVNQLLTVSLKDQYQYEMSSFLPPALTLTIDTTPSDGKCLREIEMGNQCKTGMKI